MKKIFKLVAAWCFAGVLLHLLGCEAPPRKLPRGDILTAGYRYLVFGSQVTNGITLYDIGNEKFLSFLEPQDKESRYLHPVIGVSGRGFCIKEKDIFDINRKNGEIVAFNLSSMTHDKTNIRIFS